MNEYFVRYVTTNSMIVGIRISANCINNAIEFAKGMPNYRDFFSVEPINK